ncbi:transcription elongation factor 1 homolog isoform X1 [Crassostrea virginica]
MNVLFNKLAHFRSICFRVRSTSPRVVLYRCYINRSAMGRRKKANKPPPKRKIIQALDTMFNCPFCNHEKSCEVKMDRERNTGFITCTVCLEDYQTSINYLSEPIDVYSDWIDACETANT